MVSDLAAGAARFALLEKVGEGTAARAAAAAGAIWEPVTFFLSKQISSLSSSSLQSIYFGAWWGHLVAILVFGNYLPFAKHFHVITALPNLYFAKLDPPGKMATFDIEKAAETEHFGVGKIEDFSWKQKLDFLTCTECGRCREICPTHLTGKPLTPKGFTVDLRNTLYAEADDLIDVDAGRGDGTAEARLAARKPLIGGWIDPETVWACTTCRYCEHACPVGITYVDKITDMRRHLVLEKSEFPKEAQTAFNGMERQGNPWNLAASDRGAWAKDLPFPVLTMAEVAEAKEPAASRCSSGSAARARTRRRGKKVSQALARLLHEAGVTYAILGSEETCTGDAARRLGNEYLFQTLAQQNVETMNGYGVKKIVTNCPHCFNTLANEYPDFGGKYEVMHGTELVAKLVAEGRIDAHRPRRADDLLPRPVLPRPPQRRLRRAARGPRRDPGPHGEGAAAHPRERDVLRRGRRPDVAGREARDAHQPGALRRDPGERDGRRRRVLPVLHGHARERADRDGRDDRAVRRPRARGPGPAGPPRSVRVGVNYVSTCRTTRNPRARRRVPARSPPRG